MAIFSRPSQWLYLRGTCHELAHTWHPSCVYSACEVFILVFIGAVKIYLPLFMLSNVRRLGDVRWLMKNLLPNVLMSSLFLSTNGGGFVAFICLTRYLLGRFYLYSAVFLPAFAASLTAIFIERKSSVITGFLAIHVPIFFRRGLLAGYMATLSIELIHTILKSKGVIMSVPYGEVIIFSLASAVLLHRQWTSSSSPRDSVGSLLSNLFRPPVRCSVNIFGPIITNLLWTGGWGFLCGYLLQSLLSLLSYWKKIKNKTASIKDWLSNKYSLKFGLFVASFVTWFKLSNLLMISLGVPHGLRLFISGLIAGLSMLFVRSSAISLYAGWKALEVLYSMAVKRGYARTWYYGDALLYAFCTAVIFHSVMFEGHHVREAYWKFIAQVTGNRILHIAFPVWDYFGTNASTRPKQVLQKIATTNN